jgi:hypothetical protein
VSGLELARPRDISALFGDAVGVYLRNFRAFVLLAAAIVVPVQLIVSGVGLEQLTAPYDDSLSPAEVVIPTAVSFLVVAPLITATCIHALFAVAGGGALRAGQAITAGFEAFTPIFLAILLAAAGIALGLVLLIVPGVFLAVRWFFVPQAVVIEGSRGPAALRRSAEVVKGFWWRTFGIVLLANLAATLPGLVVTIPFAALAEQADRAAWSMAGAILVEIVTTPFIALLATLLYFDLRARRPVTAGG